MKLDAMINPSVGLGEYIPQIQQIVQKALSSGKKVHLLCEVERKPRTTGEFSQNHHLNGHIQQIAVASGQSFDEVKKYIKQMAVGQGYPMLESNGEPVMDLWGNVMGISETDASTEECAILIECTHQLASFLCIDLEEGHERFTY